MQLPFTVITGSYVVDDPAKVDAEVAKPISEIALKQPNVKDVISGSQDNFFHVFVQYESDVEPQQATDNLKRAVDAAEVVPTQANVEYEKPRFGITERGDDVVISFFAKEAAPINELSAKAEAAANYLKLKNLTLVEDVSIINPFSTGIDPATGQEASRQSSFDRYGKRKDGNVQFYNSVIIGVFAKPGADILELDKQLKQAVAELNKQREFSDYSAVISATFADDIRSQLSELQRALLEGLLAAFIIGTIVISLRSSVITVLSMLSVLAITLGILYTIGYSLNTITLFALILGLALIVDDTIIMVEAIDAQRRKVKRARDAVKIATKKVARAMVAATSTAALSFAPLIFVGGILGGFIRAIPVTIITSLIISLLVALVFIPLLARRLLLSKGQIGARGQKELAEGVEAAIARGIAKPLIWAKHSRKRLYAAGITALIIGFSFIGTGGWLFQKVTFNIFPPSKDSNGIIVQLNFPPEANIRTAQIAAASAEDIVTDHLGKNFIQASYYGSGDSRDAQLFVDLTSYSKRDISAPTLVTQLEDKFAGFNAAKVRVSQVDVGPPSSDFSVRIKTDNQDAAYRLAQDISAYLDGRKLKRLSGEVATITGTSVSNPGSITRQNAERYIETTAEFDGTDTTTLVTLAEEAVKKEFTEEKLATYGLTTDSLDFDIGQESENQESFATLAIAFPAMLLAIYIVLAFQFRSLLQPALIFMAIPFSLLGITLGLYLTDNAFSFFAMLGFFALVGLSIKNTILLTDYANQARAAGKGVVDSAVEALEERFRPLIATSLTAIVSLIPLAIHSPFWEGLVVVLICGLLSSTFLVVTVFPYYYLGAEYLRTLISRRTFLMFAGLTILFAAPLLRFGYGQFVILAPLVAIGLMLAKKRAASESY